MAFFYSLLGVSSARSTPFRRRKQPGARSATYFNCYARFMSLVRPPTFYGSRTEHERAKMRASGDKDARNTRTLLKFMTLNGLKFQKRLSYFGNVPSPFLSFFRLSVLLIPRRRVSFTLRVVPRRPASASPVYCPRLSGMRTILVPSYEGMIYSNDSASVTLNRVTEAVATGEKCI